MAGLLQDKVVTGAGRGIGRVKVNLYGHFHCFKFACIVIRQHRYGWIINTSSQAGLGNMG